MEKAPDGPLPVVTFFQPRAHQVLVLFSQQTCGETALKRFLPKSHLAKVIIQDNVSVQRVQEIKERHIEDSKKKVENLFDQMKKKFIHDQQKKTLRWKKQYGHYQRMLEEIDQRNLNLIRELGSSYKLLTSQKSSVSSGGKTRGQPRPTQITGVMLGK